jgi:hypothetical protein
MSESEICGEQLSTERRSSETHLSIGGSVVYQLKSARMRSAVEGRADARSGRRGFGDIVACMASATRVFATTTRSKRGSCVFLSFNFESKWRYVRLVFRCV